jgi:hypothetical protein
MPQPRCVVPHKIPVFVQSLLSCARWRFFTPQLRNITGGNSDAISRQSWGNLFHFLFSATMSFWPIIYLSSLLVAGAYILDAYFSFISPEDNGRVWFDGGLGRGRLTQLGIGVAKGILPGVTQLPLLWVVWLFNSAPSRSAEAVSYLPVQPPSFPLAVRSPYLSGIRFPLLPVSTP